MEKNRHIWCFHIWAHLLLSFRPEKELVQPRTHFPPQLYTTIGLIKMYFICLQKSLFWALYSRKVCCFLFLASFKKPGLAAYISECTRHMEQPSEPCCRSLHIIVFYAWSSTRLNWFYTHDTPGTPRQLLQVFASLSKIRIRPKSLWALQQPMCCRCFYPSELVSVFPEDKG